MSKQLRTATTTRRGARGGYPEHDDFEGLPVRQWRQEWVTIAAPPPSNETTQQNDRWAVELPFGMPKDFNLLPPHTQELLRAARSGRLYKRPAPAEEEDADLDAPEIKSDKKEAEPQVNSFTAKAWKQVPRNVEASSASHLAKRYKNTITISSKAAVPQVAGPAVRRVTVRRTDAAGNPYEQTVTLAAGQMVDGDIVSETLVPATGAPGAELAQQPTPARRRPPPPKRKAKGPGRGRKKGRLPMTIPLPAPQPGAGGQPSADASAGPTATDHVVKIDENEDSMNQDSEMADNSGLPSDDDDGDDGDDGDEDGDEGGDEEADQTPDVDMSNAQEETEETENTENTVKIESPQDEDQEMGDLGPEEVIRPTSIEEPDETLPAVSSSEDDITIVKPRFPPLGLGGLGPLPAPTKIEGSPLKNVIVQSPTDPSPMISPGIDSTAASLSATSYMDVKISASMEISDSEVVATETSQAATVVEVEAAVPLTTTEDASPAAKPPSPVDTPPAVPVVNEPGATAPAPEEASDPTPEARDSPPMLAPKEESPPVDLQPPRSPALPPVVADDEEDGLNLLGSLERELDRQEGVSSAGSTGGNNLTTPPATVTPPAELSVASPDATAESSADASAGGEALI
ncbi:hypothetical protein B0T18DRAFT_427689 [Schizothecium vesticola]|uniref:Apopolysialoglycoprotein n=1 Tax=Schizothecium vesticola TaxID=314040 RepID=A0AA40K8D6_9PEZI|nr:hypothetical protein B0T18DRAFT_427689 [Schizothecium vesticola]